MSQNLENELIALAQKLGTTVEHLWGVLVKQTKVVMFYDISILIVCGLLLYAFYKFIRWALKPVGEDKNKYDSYKWMDTAIGGTVVGGIVSIVCLVMIFVTTYELATVIGNPEYWALNEVLKLK